MKEFNLPYFLYVGNAYPHKNLEKAIKAFVLFRKSLSYDIEFLIVSKKSVFTERLAKLIKKLDAGSFVKILGFMDDTKLNYLYKNSVGFIYPSLTEGFGLPGLEAMKNETILLCSDIPVFREIYGKHAIYFKPSEVNSIKESLDSAVSLTKAQAAQMIRENRAFIKRYSWEKMARETLEVYKSIS